MKTCATSCHKITQFNPIIKHSAWVSFPSFLSRRPDHMACRSFIWYENSPNSHYLPQPLITNPLISQRGDPFYQSTSTLHEEASKKFRNATFQATHNHLLLNHGRSQSRTRRGYPLSWRFYAWQPNYPSSLRFRRMSGGHLSCHKCHCCYPWWSQIHAARCGVSALPCRACRHRQCQRRARW